MATSSRQSALFGVNDWKAIYQTFKQADFKSYDYETLRKSFIDYLRAYYPETFNDYVESSEFIALLDVMAFMGQGLSGTSYPTSAGNITQNIVDNSMRFAKFMGAVGAWIIGLAFGGLSYIVLHGIGKGDSKTIKGVEV